MNEAQRNFASDNVAGASPELLQALSDANRGESSPYGADELTRRVEERIAALFEHDCAVLLVSSGTAANALALAALTPPWGAVLCHRDAHIDNDECGAPAFYSGGAKVVALGGEWSRVEPAAIATEALRGRGDVHAQQATCVSLTQATEGGTIYSLPQLAAIGATCREHGLRLHMDGARFANALVALDCTPAEMTWKRGVDVLSFGATKDGALGVEAIVAFEAALAAELHYRRKRAGHLASKMRFLAAQMDAWLTDGLWLRNARQANAMAARLREGLATVPGVAIDGPFEANLLFVRLPDAIAQGLLEQGYVFHADRRHNPPRPDGRLYRLVTSFATTPGSVDGLVESARRLAGRG